MEYSLILYILLSVENNIKLFIIFDFSIIYYLLLMMFIFDYTVELSLKFGGIFLRCGGLLLRIFILSFDLFITSFLKRILILILLIIISTIFMLVFQLKTININLKIQQLQFYIFLHFIMTSKILILIAHLS